MRKFVIAISLMLCSLFVSVACAYEVDLVNYALNAETSSSGIGWGYPPEWAVDGITSGNNFYHSDCNMELDPLDPIPCEGDGSWWEVDLGQPLDFDRIELYNRNDGCCPERLNGTIVLALDAARNVVFTSPAITGAAMLSVYDNGGAGFSQVQYIRVEQRENWLGIAEVMAIDSATFNHLPGWANITQYADAVATQSTEYFGWFPAGLGIDGDYGTFSHTDETTPDNWWQVDLGDTYFIDTVVAYTRFYCCPDRLVNAWVTVLDEDQNVLTEVKILEMANWGDSITVQLPPNSYGRYVHVGFRDGELNPWSGTHISISEVEVYGGNVGHAWGPSPANDEDEVATDRQLTWNVGNDPNGVVVPGTTGYYVYFGETEEDVALREASTSKGFFGLGSEVFTPTLVKDTTYYWAVDQWLDTDANSIQGPTWSFTTPLSLPVIVTQPTNATTIEGGYAKFTTAATNPLETELTYAWYKVGAPGVVVSTSETLEFIDATAADDGQYYCTVTNEYPVDTDAATLKIAKPVVDWKFNEAAGNVATDSSGNGIDGALGAGFSDADWLIDGGRSGQAGDNALNFPGDPNTSVLALEVDLDALGVDNIFKGDSSWTLITWVKILSDDRPFNLGGFGDCNIEDESDYSDRNVVLWTDNWWYIFLGPWYQYAGPNLGSGEWEMLAITYNAETLQLHMYQNVGWLNWWDGLVLNDTVENSFKINSTGISWSGVPPIQLKAVVDDYSVWDGALGAVELMMLYQGYGCFEAIPGDSNGDCQLNVVDLAAFFSEWLDCGIIPESSCW